MTSSPRLIVATLFLPYNCSVVDNTTPQPYHFEREKRHTRSSSAYSTSLFSPEPRKIRLPQEGGDIIKVEPSSLGNIGLQNAVNAAVMGKKYLKKDELLESPIDISSVHQFVHDLSDAATFRDRKIKEESVIEEARMHQERLKGALQKLDDNAQLNGSHSIIPSPPSSRASPQNESPILRSGLVMGPTPINHSFASKSSSDSIESSPSSSPPHSPHSGSSGTLSRAHRGRKWKRRIWVGTLGNSTQKYNDETKSKIKSKLFDEYDSVPVFLTDDELEGHYNQFCKQVLWKPFHYQLAGYPRGQAYEEHAWKSYVAVNQKFANAIAEMIRPNDIVWINDYHLTLVPEMLRKLVPDAIIGFFLHIPFPSSEIFRSIHVRKQILLGLLGSDLIGFQTSSFMRHFLMTTTRLLSVESTPNGIQLENTVVSVGIFPIGINLIALNERRRHFEVANLTQALREKYAGKKILIGRDKNDYVKGLRQKMLAYERFLTDHPEWIGKVVLIQVSLSTTEQNENECQVSDVVARINSKFATIEFSPVVYLHQDISFSQYLALLTVADACLITSLRDEMNLTSLEYVVCQEEKCSPLIISEFAGTYGSFGAALRVNPWDTREVAEAIHEALIMSEDEKVSRWKELYSYVSSNTAQNYVDTFVSDLVKVHEDMQHRYSIYIPHLSSDDVVKEFKKSSKRLLFLDQDGTIEYKSHVVPPLSNSATVQLLEKLVQDERNIVYLMSGRRKDDLKEYSAIKGLGICAENGCFLKHPKRDHWEMMLPDLDMSWRKQVGDIFDYYTDRTPGSFIERRDITMVWHFGNADYHFVSWQAAECMNHIEHSVGSLYPIHTLAKKKSILVMPRNVNKGTIVRNVLAAHPDADFIFAVGDDRSDEYMFEYLGVVDVIGGSSKHVDVESGGGVRVGGESGLEVGLKDAPLGTGAVVAAQVAAAMGKSGLKISNAHDKKNLKNDKLLPLIVEGSDVVPLYHDSSSSSKSGLSGSSPSGLRMDNLKKNEKEMATTTTTTTTSTTSATTHADTEGENKENESNNIWKGESVPRLFTPIPIMTPQGESSSVGGYPFPLTIANSPQSVKPKIITSTVGSKSSKAEYFLASVGEVVGVLEKLIVN